MNKKICSTCQEEKETGCFFIDMSRPDGFSYVCKECKNRAVKKYRESNPDLIKKRNKKYSKENKKKISEYRGQYYIKNKKTLADKARKYQKENREQVTARVARWRNKDREAYLEKNREYYLKNRDAIRLKGKEYYQKNKGKVNKYMRMKRRTDPNFRIMESCRTRIRICLKEQCASKNNHRTTALIGCTVQEYREYIENLFVSGMDWGNYGLHGWHIDHIKPISKFDLTDEAEMKKAFNYKNTQPLWAEDNLKKGSRY